MYLRIDTNAYINALESFHIESSCMFMIKRTFEETFIRISIINYLGCYVFGQHNKNFRKESYKNVILLK
jgi:hypothetical protein